jgi:predicted TIM-barrel fold metal-dependent hydrolase
VAEPLASAPTGPYRIDCQSHLFVPEIVALMEKRTTDPVVYRRGEDRFVRMGEWHRRMLPNHFDVDAKLRSMDENQIQLTALSINDPGPEWFGDAGVDVAQSANDFIAAVVRKHPTRFLGLCVLPWQNVPAALGELDRCVNKLGMKGLLLYTNLAGQFPDEPAFRPVLARAAELSRVAAPRQAGDDGRGQGLRDD